MKKINFNYKKEDGTITERVLLYPTCVEKAQNKTNSFDNERTNYISGYEIDTKGLTEGEIKRYEEIISDYFELALPTMEQFLKENSCEPKRVLNKMFKKSNIENFKQVL